MSLYALAAYLVAIGWLRRSRGEILAALGVHWAAFALFVHGRMAGADMSIWLLGGWSWLAGLHIMIARPRWVATIWPVALMVVVTTFFGARPALFWYAAGHAGGLVVILVVVGWLWPWTRYRTLGVLVAATFATLGIGRGVAHGAHPKATLAVLCAFLLLAAGTAISWHKRRLLGVTDTAEPRPLPKL